MKKPRTGTALLLLALALLASPAHAQDAIVTTAAPIYLLPDTMRTPLRTAAVNTRLRVLEEAPEGWVKVEFRDPQFGMRIGYIEARFVRILRPELTPMDLSVKEEPARATPPDRVEPPAVQRAPARRSFARGWIDVNLGLAVAGEKEYESAVEGILHQETARFSASYRAPLGAGFDFGGGVMVTPAFGLGIGFAGTAHRDEATLGIRIPHPTQFNAHASDTAETDRKLTRAEGSVNIQAVFAGRLSENLTARLYGGPSFFRLRQEAVSDIIYRQEFLIFLPVNEVEITRYETQMIDFDEATGWGFHVGGDVNVFFSRVVGAGGFARFSRGRVRFHDPFAEARSELKTGGLQTGGGLRLRF